MKNLKPPPLKVSRVPPATTGANRVRKIDRKQLARMNKILGALPAGQFNRLLPKMQAIQLNLNEVLFRPGERIEYVYFLSQGIVSLLTILEDGTTIESAVVGSEGMVGISVIMGVDQTTNEALVQASGHALRMRAEDLRISFNRDRKLRDLLLRYTYLLFSMVAQNAACNQMHTVEERLARWLLLTHDRVGRNDFEFTQKFMSHMLAVRRAGVSVAANRLRRAGLIDYQRGEITVLDRPGLEGASCECYRTIEAQANGFHQS